MQALRTFLFALLAAPTVALLVQPRVAAPAPLRALRSARPSMQFGGGDPERKGITRDTEPDEFFATNMDDMSDEEKLKSPVVIGGLIILIAPFLVGAIALQFYRVRYPASTLHSSVFYC